MSNKCPTCDEDRFGSRAELEKHKRLNHYQFPCPKCGHRFPDKEKLNGHKNIKRQNQCSKCCMGFSSKEDLIKHRSDKNHGDPHNPKRCPCGKEFESQEELKSHRKETENDFIPCLTCATPFKSIRSLEQHKEDTYHYKTIHETGTVLQELHAYFEAYNQDQVMMSRSERRRSRLIVQDILKQILDYVRGQKGGDLYGKLRTDGSCGTQTKIRPADEFDYNIPINVDVTDIRRRGIVGHYFESISPRLTSKAKLIQTPVGSDGQKIPNGYAVAKTEAENHEDYTFDGFIIPRFVQEDLYERIKGAINNVKLKNDVSIQSISNGPAVTLIIKRKGEYDISVDIAAAIDNKCVHVSEHGWPRPDTKKCLTEEKVDVVLAAGTHILPKDPVFWHISYSKAAKKLMNMIDSFDECRKKCHKMLKADFRRWKSESTTAGLRGISTYVFKHHLLWMNEKYTTPGYWKNSNIGQCYTDMLHDLEEQIHRGSLLNYFNTTENILGNKKPEVLKELKSRINDRKQTLLHIKIK